MTALTQTDHRCVFDGCDCYLIEFPNRDGAYCPVHGHFQF